MIWFDKVIHYKIEFNPVSNTWCLYRENIKNQQRVFKPIYQSIEKKNVEDVLEKILNKKGKRVNERTIQSK